MSKKDTAASPNSEISQEAAIWDRFQTIETERHMFNPNKGCDGALFGYLLNVLSMPPLERGTDRRTGEPILQDWECFLVKTTRETKVQDRSGDIIVAPVGSEVLMPATFTLTRHLREFGLQPDKCFEVGIQPKEKIDIGHGQTLWRYRLGFDPKTAKSRASFGPAALLGAPAEAAQLPSSALNDSQPQETVAG